MGAAVVGRRLRPRRLAGPLRHQQRRGQRRTVSTATAATARSRTSPSAMGVADVNRAGTGVSMGAVWGDYDNDGFEDLFLYKWGRPELFHNDGGKRLHARHRHGRPAGVGQRQHAPSGSTTTATAGSTSSSPATGPRRSNLWHLDDHEDDAGELRVRRRTAAASTCSATSATARSRRSRAALGLDSAPLGAGRGRRRPARHRLSRPVPRQRLRRLGAVRQRGRQAFREIGKRDRRRLRAQERHERRRSATSSTRAGSSIYVTNISEEGVLIQGNNLWVPTAGDAGGRSQYENLAARDGRRAGRLELRARSSAI